MTVRVRWLTVTTLTVLMLSTTVAWSVLRDARERERRSVCQGYLKYLVIAMHNYYDVHGHFPPAVLIGPDGKPWHSWRALLLPYLDCDEVRKEYRLDEPWDGPNNRRLHRLMPKFYACPSDPAAKTSGHTNYVVVAEDGRPFQDLIRLRTANFDLDVNDNLNTTDAVDGFWGYMPGYVGATPVLSTGAFASLTPLAPQPLHAILNGAGTDIGVGQVTASLTGVSAIAGYTGNVADPGDGAFSNMDDVSFSRTSNQGSADTDSGGGVSPDKAWLNFFVRDYAATANLNVWVKDAAGNTRGSSTKQVVRDTDHDGMQDGWEVQKVQEYETQYSVSFQGYSSKLDVFGSGEPSAVANEDADPDGSANGDGGRNLVAHKAAGDSLTPFQEYRGYILDGGGFDGLGQNGHAGGHKRLSPAYKEYLWEVDAMQGIEHLPPGAINAALAATAKDFSDNNKGAGIRVYWVISENQTPYNVFGDPLTTSDSDDYTKAHRDPLLKQEFAYILFAADHKGRADVRGVTSNGAAVIYMEKVWSWATAASYDFMTNLRWTIAHEMTHILLNESNTHGFNDGEHLIDPDEDGDLTINEPGDAPEVMYIYSNDVNNNSQPFWFVPTLRRMDLNSKEGVER